MPSSASPADPSNSLYSAVLYLSPADYHHIHAPAGLAIEERVHVPGRLLPVLEAYAAHGVEMNYPYLNVLLRGDGAEKAEKIIKSE